MCGERAPRVQYVGAYETLIEPCTFYILFAKCSARFFTTSSVSAANSFAKSTWRFWASGKTIELDDIRWNLSQYIIGTIKQSIFLPGILTSEKFGDINNGEKGAAQKGYIEDGRSPTSNQAFASL